MTLLSIVIGMITGVMDKSRIMIVEHWLKFMMHMAYLEGEQRVQVSCRLSKEAQSVSHIQRLRTLFFNVILAPPVYNLL